MSSNKAILIVDDEFIILESLRIQISRILPQEVLLEAASSGEEAIQLIDQFHAENKNLVLVISDFHLDDLKGTDILKHAVIKFSNVEKVILSGQSNAELIQEFKNDYGLNAIINKPWDFSELQDIILPLVS